MSPVTSVIFLCKNYHDSSLFFYFVLLMIALKSELDYTNCQEYTTFAITFDFV